MRRNRFLTNFGSTISDIQLESGKIKKNPLKLILWIMVKLTSWGRLKDVQLQVHSLGLHIRPYGDVLRTSQGRPAADAYVGVTYRTIWGQSEDVSTLGMPSVRPQDVILPRGYWSYFKTVSINPKTCYSGEVENVSLAAGKHFHICLW